MGLHEFPRHPSRQAALDQSHRRLNGEIGRRTDVVGTFPNEEAVVRPVGAILLEQNDEWAVQRCRYLPLETMAALSDDPIVSLPIMASLTNPVQPEITGTAPVGYTTRWDAIASHSGRKTMRFKFLVADDISLYAVKPTGELLWFPVPGPSSGLLPEAGVQIGHGWDEFSQLVAGGDGVLYGIRPNGDLLWYRDTSRFAFSAWHPNSGQRIGNGWDRFVQVVSGGDGILYALEASGDLYWYRDLNCDGTANWDAQSGKRIGVGWNMFHQVAGGADGILYGITPKGTLHWYRDIFRTGTNAHDGSNGWDQNSGRQIGFDWQTFTHVIAGVGGVLIASRCREECGELLWYRDDNRDGSNDADGSGGWDTQSGSIVGTRFETAPIEGYCWPVSAEPGQTIDFFVSSMEGPVFNVGYVTLREQADGSYGEFFQGSLSLGVGGHYQVSTDLAWQEGCGWSPSFRLTVPVGWASGLYAARCTTPQGFAYQIPFIVKPAANGPRGEFLVIANTNTWTAYNRWSGHSNYTFNDPKTLSYLRPNNHLLTGPRDHATGNHLLRGEVWVLDWLHREGFKADVCSDLDWAAGNLQPERYRGLILQTHPEYWSTGMRDLLAQQMAKGMNLINIGGNAIFRAVRDPGSTPENEFAITGPRICTASDGSEQTLNDGGSLRSLIGTAYNWGTPAPTPYTIDPEQAGHWAFHGVPGLGTTGQTGSIGGPGRLGLAACGWEADTARLGTATPDAPDFSPANTVLLGWGPTQYYGFTKTSPNDGDATGHLLCFTTPAGGLVFAAPSISFGASLAVDCRLRIMMRNVLTRCLRYLSRVPLPPNHLTSDSGASGVRVDRDRLREAT